MVLPAPDGPTMEINSFGSIERVTFSRATELSGYTFETRSKTIIAFYSITPRFSQQDLHDILYYQIMKRYIKIVGIVLVITAILLLSSNYAVKNEKLDTNRKLSSYKLSLSPSLKITSGGNVLLAQEAWVIFQSYLESARLHDLPSLKKLSYQLSDTCKDESRKEECFALMDNVYNIASPFEASEFKNIQADGRQITLYTDGPVVAILFFVRDTDGTPKVLGLRFCSEEGAQNSCVETDPIKRDLDGNGWWDSTESLFYQPQE